MMSISRVPIITRSKALNYYEGIRHRPKLLATTFYRTKPMGYGVEEPCAVEMSGNQAWVYAKEEIIALLESISGMFTAIQPVQFKRDTVSNYPLTLWIQVMGFRLHASDAAELVRGCLEILEKHQLLNMQVEIYEPSSPFRQNFYRLLPSQPSLVGGSELSRLAGEGGICYEHNQIWSIMEVSEILLPVGTHEIYWKWNYRLAEEFHEMLSLYGVEWSSLDVVRYNEFKNEADYKNRHDDFPVVLWVGVPPNSLSVSLGMCVARALQEVLEERGIKDVRVQLRESTVIINHYSCEMFDPAEVTDSFNQENFSYSDSEQARRQPSTLKFINLAADAKNINVEFEKIEWKRNTVRSHRHPSPSPGTLEIAFNGILTEREMRDTKRIKGPLDEEASLERLNTVLFERGGEISVGQLNNICSYIHSNGMILKRWPVFPFVPPQNLIQYHSKGPMLFRYHTTLKLNVAVQVAKPFSTNEDVGSLIRTIDGKVAGALDGGAGNRGLFDISYLAPVNHNFDIVGK